MISYVWNKKVKNGSFLKGILSYISEYKFIENGIASTAFIENICGLFDDPFSYSERNSEGRVEIEFYDDK